MEYRRDLEQLLLLNGLPADERQHAVKVISDLTVQQLDWKRGAGPAAEAASGATAHCHDGVARPAAGLKTFLNPSQVARSASSRTSSRAVVERRYGRGDIDSAASKGAFARSRTPGR
jgi:hypothetical protein